MRNNYLFRLATSLHFLMLRWIAAGGITNLEADKLRNDVIDMSYVAYATFFEGLLTRDKKMRATYREVRLFLEQVFPLE
jgi:hypothetical protein